MRIQHAFGGRQAIVVPAAGAGMEDRQEFAGPGASVDAAGVLQHRSGARRWQRWQCVRDHHGTWYDLMSCPISPASRN